MTLNRMLLACLLIAGLWGFTPALARAQEEVRTHTVQAGETLYSIARQYDLSVSVLQQLNDIEGSVIRVGQVLQLAPTPGEAPAPSTVDSVSGAPDVRSVSPDVSIFDAAFRLGIAPDTILALNPSLPAVFAVGDSLLIPDGYSTTTIRIRSGDTLFGLAARHDTTIEALRRLNDLRSDRLAVGQRLEVPSGDDFAGRTGLPPVTAEGLVIVYPDRFEGRLTASGRPYDPAEYMLAHPTMDLGAVVLVTATGSGRAVFAEVADRMPARTAHVAEISAALAMALGTESGPVEIRLIDRPEGP